VKIKINFIYIMSETIAILGMAFLCGTSILLAKLCAIRTSEHRKDYVLLTQEEYQAMQHNAVIAEQPLLPEYSEKAPLIN
jgi:Tfp pilus assembly protein PilV